MNEILEYLAITEGTVIHFNKKESDITSMFGIYKVSHPGAHIFSKINSLARLLGIKKTSNNWNKEDLNKINTFIKESHSLDLEFYNLAASFYEDYLKGARLNMFHKDCKVAMYSMYVNSPRLAWKSVQFAINCMNSNELINHYKLKEDGRPGRKTKSGLKKALRVCNENPFLGLLFESDMLMGMACNYSILIKKNPNKYIVNSTGWDNRLKDLMRKR